tara:strand:+ start:254 stop:1891 length:1638 start_codon:yes stop_codon:yes gene_type:complete
MVKITSDTNLIRGAATAYRNYDNAAGMYAGLDKVTEAGMDLMEKNIKQRKEVEKKFDDASEGVLLKSGALGGKLYESSIVDVKKLRELYIDGVNTKDEKKKMDAMVGLQNLSIFVQDHKQTNLDIADLRNKGDLSSYYEENAKGREKAKIITQILNQDYSSVSANQEGDKVFHVKGLDGKEIKVSSKEYREMSSTLRNYKTGNGYLKTLNTAKKDEIFSEDMFRQGVKQALPKTKNEWDAAAYDDISGTNLEEMLNSSETLDQEILMSVDPKAWDTDPEGKAGVLDPSEKAAFIDAVLNTENDFFNLGVSNQILEDQLTNAGRNSHGKHWLDINNKKQKILDRQANANKKDGRNLPYGFRTWGQMKEDYDLIQNTAVGDTYNAPTGHIFTREKNMAYLGPDGKTYTPNQLKRFIKIDHLDDFAEPAGGYTTPRTTEEEKAIEAEAKKQFPRPDRSIITESFGTQSSTRVINKLNELYKDYPGFTFDRAADKQLRILAPDGVTEIFVDMGKPKATLSAGNSQDKIRDFIYEYLANENSKENNEFAE